MQCGIAIGISAADALFLNYQGASQLPIVYLLSPIVIVGYIISHTFLIGRLGIAKVFDITLVLLAFALIGISFLLTGSLMETAAAQSVYYAAKLLSMVAFVALYTLYWNVADSYFNILDAKRLFAYLSAGCAVGAASGGALVYWLTAYFRVEQLFLLWALLCLLSIPVAARIRSSCKKLDSEQTIDDRSLMDEIKNLAGTYRRSSFAICITASLFITLILCLICEFQYYGIFAAERSDSELAALLGSLNFAVSIFNLVVNLFLFNRLVEYIGVKNLTLIQPIAYMAVFCFLVVDHTEMAAVMGFFIYHGLFISIDGNNFNLLLNALPNLERKQLRTFIEGACEPLAHAFVGGGLVLTALYLSPAQISMIGLALAVICLLTAFLLRTYYATAMVDNLRSDWLDFSQGIDANINSSYNSKLSSSSISNLLEQAAYCNPSERRALELHISALAARAVPGCVKALDNELLPIPTRSLAARVLSRVSFPQLESMSVTLVDRALRAAYETFIWERDLAKLNLSSEFTLLAKKVSENKREALIEFALEILTLSGKLARFEPLAASLRSNDQKSKGIAIETIEQACSLRLRQLLRPLLDERESDKRLLLALELNRDQECSPLERFISGSRSLDDLEAAISRKILHCSGENEALAEAQKITRQDTQRLFDKLEKAKDLLKYSVVSNLTINTLLALADSSIEKANGGRTLIISEEGLSIYGDFSHSTANILSDQATLFDFENLIRHSKKDSLLAKSLYYLLRNSDNEFKAVI